MQTFLPYTDIEKSAEVLDYKRLGKQRVEAIQIVRTLFSITSGWNNHPAVKMWRNYESFLIKIYLRTIMNEWKKRGYRNVKCEEHYRKFISIIGSKESIQPIWLNESLCITHRSKLIQKDEKFYGPLFPDTPRDLEYLWPV
jgi:hypothetical protein